MAKMSKVKAASILSDMLYEHECNSAFIDFEEDKEWAKEWKRKQQALKMAINCLERK